MQSNPHMFLKKEVKKKKPIEDMEVGYSSSTLAIEIIEFLQT